MSSKYKLLWLNGPLQGRELSLPLGCMSIGPDGDVLATLVELRQLELFIDDAGVHLQSEVSTWIDGKPASKLDLLPLGRVIEFAGIAMVLGERTMYLGCKRCLSRCCLNRKCPIGCWLLPLCLPSLC
ncbi:hypothetical protein [Shewanella psychropiezotolerans]|uniref:hypothetical protein n=1 Tax=Shewanella psychropiezotolerans TaxID=2593655 RepID=UPI001E3D8C98|nr:hypothetical protein [Shewanella psychropiezotolerans]